MIRLCLAVVFGALTIATLSGIQAVEEPLRIEGGMLAGTRGRDASIRVFKGIPFAAPPVGSRRWMPPQPVVPWDGVRNAAAFSAMCMQPPRPAEGSNLHDGTPETISEDCLYLNVWTPAAGAPAALRETAGHGLDLRRPLPSGIGRDRTLRWRAART